MSTSYFLKTANLDCFERKLLRPDEELYFQGQPNQGAFILVKGEIALSRTTDDNTFPVATIAKGELIGEMSALEGMPHSVSARAVGIAEVLCIQGEILQHILRDPLVRFIVTTLASRLRDTLNQNKNEPDVFELPTGFQVDITGASEVAAHVIPTAVTVPTFPCKIGGRGGMPDGPQHNGTALDIPNDRLKQLNSNHFELIMRDRQLCLRDLGTVGSTTVNGRLISKYGKEAVCTLKKGMNRVTCGKDGNPASLILKVSHI